MSRHDITYLLDRYLEGTISDNEKALVEKWLAEHQHENNEWQQLTAAAREKWLADLFTGIEQTISAEAKVVPLQGSKTNWRIIAAIAACLTLFFMLLLEWPVIHGWFSTDNLVAMQVPADQKRKITLSDGSMVWVNAGSTFKYPQAFNGKTREVYLSGEAYFDIKHDAAKAFIVHTGKLQTTVLGTAFNINALNTSSRVIVTVTRGKVSVSNGKKLIGYITPDEQITYDTKTDAHSQTSINASRVIAWQQDSDIHFEDMAFGDAAKELESRFKVHISFVNEKVKNCRFTGTALKGRNIDQILKVICAINNASYHYSADHTIMIDGNGCN